MASEGYEAPHWNPEAAAGTANYIDINFDVFLSGGNFEIVFPRERLDCEAYAGVHWNTQSSGILIHAHQAEYLEAEWAEFLSQRNITLGFARPLIDLDGPTSIALREGKKAQVLANTYERNPKARARCLKHYGLSCAVCGFNFVARYGVIGASYIQVHHLKPLSEVGEEHEVDPIRDLRPVCANCHVMLHTRNPPLSIEELEARLK